jgi:hypothetical protein
VADDSVPVDYIGSPANQQPEGFGHVVGHPQ